MEKEEAKREVAKLVSKFSAIPKNELDSMKEEQIKFKFIEPLLYALGWKTDNIDKEETVLKGRADYILKIDNSDKLVIEAKSTNVKLSEVQGKQAVEYAYNKNNINFAVVTNFKQIRIYHALSNPRDIEKNLLRDKKGYLWINYEDFISQFDRLWLISRESFQNGEIDKLLVLREERIDIKIDKILLEDFLDIRELLSKDINKVRQLSPEQVDEIVQILINRFIFMRCVEDRGMEEKDYLLNIVKNHESGRTERRLWEVLKTNFKIFNKEYDSKIFEEGLLESKAFFDDSILIKVIKGLYHGIHDNHGRYYFDLIPQDILGIIYEQYLGIVLRGTEKRIKLDSKSGKRKKMGIYYTPSYIVDYIVKNTVGEYIKNKSIDEILEIKILDPTCGSGSFIVKAFEYICKRIEELLKEGKGSEKFSFFNFYKGRLGIAQKNTIFENCIFGVDLDEKAVELAELNIALKILENETRLTKRKLSNLKNNIRCGNSLIDDTKIAGDKAFNWRARFPEVFSKGGFDVIIGNPPYVDIKQLPSNMVKYLFIKYSTVENRMNLYSTFVEKTFSILKEKGNFGFIIPNSILYNESYQKIRKLLLDNVSFKKIVRLPNNVFGDATVETVILIYNKTNNKSNNCEIIVYPSDAKINSIDSTSKSIVVSQLNWLNDGKLNISQNESGSLIKKIELSTIPLIDLCDFSLGLTPYDKYKGHSKKQIDGRVFHSTKKKDETFKPLLSGSNIIRYGIFWDGKEYISYGKWLGAPREKRFFTEPRIIIRQILSGNPIKIYSGYTEEEFYNAQIGFNLLPKSKKTNLKIILAILNSNLMSFYHKEKFLDQSKNLFQKILIANAKKFPIRLPDSNQEDKIIELVDQILDLQKRYYNTKSIGGEKDRLSEQIKDKDYEINQEIYKLYNINYEEQKIIEESLK